MSDTYKDLSFSKVNILRIYIGKGMDKEKVDFKGRRNQSSSDSEEITKSPTDAFVEHAKEESAEFRDFMVRYLPFTIIGYLLILLFFQQFSLL